jgi:hypothetical protein
MFIHSLLVAVTSVLLFSIPHAHAVQIESATAESVRVYSSHVSTGGHVYSASSGAVSDSKGTTHTSVFIKTVVNGETILDIHETATDTPLFVEAHSTPAGTYTAVSTTSRATIRTSHPPTIEPHAVPYTPDIPDVQATALSDPHRIAYAPAKPIITLTNGHREYLYGAPNEHNPLLLWSPVLGSFTHTIAYVLSCISTY